MVAFHLATLVFLCASAIFVENGAEATRLLSTFEEIRDFAIQEYGVISATFDTSRCEVSQDQTSQFRNKIIMEHLNDVWLWVKLTDGAEEMRATDVFVDGKWSFVAPTLFSRSNTARLTIIDMAGGDLSVLLNITITCQIGDGAKFYGQDRGVSREEYRNYDQLKQAVTNGKQLIARALTTSCPGPSWEPFGIEEFIANFKIYAARIENEDTPEETLVLNFFLFSVAFADFVESPVALETVAYVIKPDQSTAVLLGPIDLSNFKIPFKPRYNCTTGTTFFVSAIETDKDVKNYRSYKEVLGAVESGQNINAVMDARLCQWSDGRRPDDTEVHVRRFNTWINGVNRPYHGHYLGFFHLSVINEPKKIQEKFWVFDNDSVVYQVQTIDPVAKTSDVKTATCTLGCSFKLGSDERRKESITCYDGLRAAVIKAKYVTWWADFKKCDGPVESFSHDSFGGGVMENVEIDGRTGEIYSTGNAISTFLANGAPVRIQQPVSIRPDGIVTVSVRTNVADPSFKQIGKIATFVCALGESAFFYV